jgi:hypothetical protein
MPAGETVLSLEQGREIEKADHDAIPELLRPPPIKFSPR